MTHVLISAIQSKLKVFFPANNNKKWCVVFVVGKCKQKKK